MVAVRFCFDFRWILTGNSAVELSYNMMIFLQNTHKIHLIRRLLGRQYIYGVCFMGMLSG